ncbi:MAG TPA: hypothetical protein VFL85_00670 [Candidatus Saccharimonadales bacterium]|nr:hypothetical protein [Candidatus Saccharimonadales bacterium]
MNARFGPGFKLLCGIAAVQVVAFIALEFAYFRTRLLYPGNNPDLYIRAEWINALSSLALALSSLVVLGLLVRQGVAVLRGAEFNRGVLALVLFSVLLWACIVAVYYVFPPVFRGV